MSMQTDEPKGKPLPWFEVLEVVFRRRWWVLVGLLIGVGAATWVAVTPPPVYRARARILLSDRSTVGSGSRNLAPARFSTEIAFLRSPELIRSVLEKESESVDESDQPTAELEGSKRFVKDNLPGLYSWIYGAPDPFEVWIQDLARRIDVVHVSRSNILEISYVSRNPDWSATLINALIDRHIEQVPLRTGQSRVRTFYETQADLQEEKWRTTREELAAFRASYEDHLPGGDRDRIEQVLADLESERAATEAEVEGLRVRADFLLAEMGRNAERVEAPGILTAPSRSERNPSQSSLEARIEDLKLERIEMLSRYPEKSVFMVAIDRRIEELEKLRKSRVPPPQDETEQAAIPSTPPRVERSSHADTQILETDLTQTRAQLVAAEKRVEVLTDDIAQYSQTIRDLQAASTELERLENEASFAEESYQSYLRKAEAARFSGAMDESKILDVTVIERAKVPTNPLPSGPLRLMLMGVVGGLLLGVGAAVVRDFWDPSVKSATQTARLGEARVIVEIPFENN